MRWLWLISVGVTDVQFPVWKQDAYGQWQAWRFRRERGGMRRVHQDLLNLLDQNKLSFPDNLPRDLPSAEAGELKLEFVQEGEDFVASIATTLTGRYQIAARGNEIPCIDESRLPLYFPKVCELLETARITFGQDPVSVVVLNTCRDQSLPVDGPDEPMASGPLVAKFLAERLDLIWQDNGGQAPFVLEEGISTWLNILIDQETVENENTQRQVIHRLTQIIQNWNRDTNDRILISTSGGIPPLKPLIERTPAICLGAEAILRIESQRRAPAHVEALDFNARIAEKEVLRFHCVQALRQSDYAGAYGLARRFPEEPWAQQLCNQLGPFLAMPAGANQQFKHAKSATAQNACYIEMALTMSNSMAALIRMGRFLESVIWMLIARDRRIQALGLQINREDESLVGVIPNQHELFMLDLLKRHSGQADHHKVTALTWGWPSWLANEDGGQIELATTFNRIIKNYNREPKAMRNQIVHGADDLPTPNKIAECLRNHGLIAGVNKAYGQNFLAVNDVSDLLKGLGEQKLAANTRQQLVELQTMVISSGNDYETH